MFDRNYAWPIVKGTDSPWAYHANYFSEIECDIILQQGLMLPVNLATVNKNSISTDIRKSSVSFFDPADIQTRWIFDRLQQAVLDINHGFWNYDLRFIECIQFTRYTEPGDFYTGHMDMRNHALEHRKLSISVQLTDPDHYTGSNLKLFRYGDQWDTAPKTRGTVVVFPSYHVHEVTPLESGARYSLVSWVVGPPFK